MRSAVSPPRIPVVEDDLTVSEVVPRYLVENEGQGCRFTVRLPLATA